jgi:peptidyl-prolyl cis-trans isomerase C
MVPEFDKVVFSAPVGQVQGPVKTQFGYHLVLVTSRA